MKNNNNLSNETIACIRTNVRKFLKDFKNLSKYMVNKIIKAEIDNPQRWFNGDRNETMEDSVRNYYNAVGAETSSMNGAQMKFMDSVEMHCNIKLKDYV